MEEELEKIKEHLKQITDNQVIIDKKIENLLSLVGNNDSVILNEINKLAKEVKKLSK